MQLPLKISFRDMPPSDAIAVLVRTRVARLEKYFDRISSCRVMIDAPHRHHHQGRRYHVRIDMKVPGREIVVGGDQSGSHTHEDIRVAIRNSFDALQRQLQDYVRMFPRKLRRNHEAPTFGKVLRIVRGDGEYGFLQTADGLEVYFHRNSVLHNHFDQLQPGMEVRYVLEAGEEGPQASTVEMTSPRASAA